MTVTSCQTDILVKAVAFRAAEIGIATSIAILDTAGHFRAFLGMDDAWLGSIDAAVRKARTSVLFEMETQELWEVCEPETRAHDGPVTFTGGIPLRSRDCTLPGAIGISGGQVAQDYDVACACAAALRE
jgi:uncharacterized protein GlcG (DUF336 family)